MSGEAVIDQHAHRIVVEARRPARWVAQPVDGVGFAKRVLDVIKPAQMTVVLRATEWELEVLTGRQWNRPEGWLWAEVAIPPDASRELIALTLAELTGRERSPLMLNVLIALADEYS